MFENFSFSNTVRSADDSMDGCSPLFSPTESPWGAPSQLPSSLFDPDYSLTSSQPSRRKMSICTSLNSLSINHRSQPASASTPSPRYSESSINSGRSQIHNSASRSSSHPRHRTPRTVSHTLNTDVRLQRMLLSQLQAMAPQTIAPRISLSSPRSSRASSEDLTDSDSDASWKRAQASRAASAGFSGTKSDGKIQKRKKKVIRQRKREDAKDDTKWGFRRGSGWA
ncbi:hypothetical protein BJ508DRAFT_323330 [Ascobolus immersus RN42]|uniref:Uncharacterized protein n=1 Tax=Ascobolus immersus RN42 TaxID=1160509 RepID=A0A3N4IKQ9_ASCIM|nr:hypothetical protein BJ508DRAFT_323330 [Ascobolus immersus RN42]